MQETNEIIMLGMRKNLETGKYEVIRVTYDVSTQEVSNPVVEEAGDTKVMAHNLFKTKAVRLGLF